MQVATPVCFGFKIKLKFPGPSGKATWQVEARESKVHGLSGQPGLKIKTGEKAGWATLVLSIQSRACMVSKPHSLSHIPAAGALCEPPMLLCKVVAS